MKPKTAEHAFALAVAVPLVALCLLVSILLAPPPGPARARRPAADRCCGRDGGEAFEAPPGWRVQVWHVCARVEP